VEKIKKSTWRSQIDFKDAIASKKPTHRVLPSAPIIQSIFVVFKI
jgi:hypothetical protein